MRNSTILLPSIYRAKILARTIKTQRSPDWPTALQAELPGRDVCDRLVYHYFRTVETLYRILHIPTFRKDYEAIWVDGPTPSTGFMVQFRLVLAIGAISYDENCSLRADATRWICEAQTWTSNPSSKSRLGLEYLQINILLLLARELVDIGSEMVWITAGSLLREAIYIGLHKDPSQLPRLNQLDCELRRRIWNTILEINLQFSLIAGGPCLISLEDFNTKPPANFEDEVLGLPDTAPAPEHILTSTSLAIALRKTLPVRLQVVKFLNDIATTGTYEETLRLDADVRAAHKTLRHTFQKFWLGKPGGATSTFAAEAAEFIMQRYISSLHVPYFNPSLHDAVYAFSRKAVLDTSLKIWYLACPTPQSLSDRSDLLDGKETDMTRLCRCGAGFFRAFTFHASTFLTAELRAQYQEDDTIPRPDLLQIPQEAADLVLRCLEAGETGIKGYLLLRVFGAQIDGIKRRLGKDEMMSVLGKAAEDAVSHCLPLLERIAGVSETSAADNIDAVDFDFQVSPDFLEDWDLVMSDVFNFEAIST
ncbi:hypothetical protein EK21DRAFT_63157 [Setomelanomma holmii]|uniref:Xylanolytic transcriptional activator regulatory domain-containing protein n=1 Tax=Setomelanomma holmii TaxID=210430 RepID=A0A9P4HCE0_9PLEO|nr:hypothetical protein EK21DRAFT_63157 [Setomelanomma holmii]